MPVNLEKARDNFRRYEYARDNGHIDYLTKAKRCENFFQGLQWEEAIRKLLERQKKPVMTVNMVLAVITAIMGEQLQNRADVTFTPFRNGNSESATALAKTHMHTMNANDYQTLESEMFDDGVIGSRGYIDCRISFDDHMMGEVELSLLNPYNVIPGSEANSYDPDDWNEVFITKWLTPDEIETQYDAAAEAALLRNRGTSVFEFGYDSIDTVQQTFGGLNASRLESKPEDIRKFRVIERQYRKNMLRPTFVDPETGDTRVVPLNWSAERAAFAASHFNLKIIKRRTAVIHWLVTVEDIVLHDAESPYKHFTPIPYFPYFRRGKTMGLVESLLNPQEIMNKVLSQELHVLNSSANGGWKIKKNSLSNMDIDELETRGATTGLVLELEEVTDAEKIGPNQIPSGLDRISFKMDEFIKELSGSSDSRRGFDREDVAAKAIQAKRAAGNVNLAKPFENLVRTRKMVARNALDLYQEYYIEARMLQITSDTPGAQNEEVGVNQMTPEGEVLNDLTVGEYSVVVTSVPSNKSFMESQNEEALRMREIGVAIPDEFIIQNSTLAKKSEMLEAMQNTGEQERQQKLADLEVQDKEMELREREVDMQRKGEEAKLASARAGKTNADAMATMQEGQDGDERQQAQVDMQVAREKMLLENNLAREKMMLEMALKKEQMRQENLLRQAESAERLEIEKARVQQASQNREAAA